ncbi:iron(III) transport system substrate-binding protein [Acetoanaerobium pronyense]|uniref:Iron(III) transport system substrate-binding protein n=1 Tax=Acetoanaerobium pronyense TaxID=1482736 RepID=A0ABS4KHL0_9FIRM|nr:Fe(3+) ABC transporter substrate-binding protein [Acetoanaerobium pronyense]MBP2026850.1 iron(III) transport system substrate-binding protein [Acetoanaerobium pronyense]
MNKTLKLVFLAIVVMSLLITAGCGSLNEEPTTEPEDKGFVNLYTSRHYDIDRELYDMFEEQTGIKVNVVEGKGDELMERLDREAEATEADLFITVDAGNLARLKERGLTQPINSDVIESNIPEKLRDLDNAWVGLTKRARVIVYAKDRVDPSELSTYEALTESEWKNRVLIRSSENIYNQSLLASFIHLKGEEASKDWAAGIVANMAREPQGGDTDQVKAVVAGEGDVAISNTYYVGRLLNSENPEDVKVGQAVGIFFPNQDSTGTHINISGAALVKHAKNVDNAIKFLEFLTDVKAQKVFAEGNNEYPANPNAEISETLKSWGEFKEQDINLTIVGDNNAKAIQTFNEIGWK